jgi:hypothetical protein
VAVARMVTAPSYSTVPPTSRLLLLLVLLLASGWAVAGRLGTNADSPGHGQGRSAGRHALLSTHTIAARRASAAPRARSKWLKPAAAAAPEVQRATAAATAPTGEQRLVRRSLALQHHAINRDLLACGPRCPGYGQP